MLNSKLESNAKLKLYFICLKHRYDVDIVDNNSMHLFKIIPSLWVNYFKAIDSILIIRFYKIQDSERE